MRDERRKALEAETLVKEVLACTLKINNTKHETDPSLALMYLKQYNLTLSDTIKALKKIRLDEVALPRMIEVMYTEEGDILNSVHNVCPLAAATRLLDKNIRLQHRRQKQKDKIVEAEKQRTSIITKGVAEINIPVLSLKYESNNLLSWIRVVYGKLEGIQEIPTHEGGLVAALKNSLVDFPLEEFTNCLTGRQLLQTLRNNYLSGPQGVRAVFNFSIQKGSTVPFAPACTTSRDSLTRILKLAHQVTLLK